MEQVQLAKLDSKNYNQQEYLNSQMENEGVEEDSDFLILTKEEKILSKILLRNILYSDKDPLPNKNINSNNEEENFIENEFHKKISEILLNNFNFSERDMDRNSRHNYNSDFENSLIYQTPKRFYIDWSSSKIREGKFNLKISTQSKNIIFEDLFTPINNKLEENEISLIKEGQNQRNSSSSESDSDLFSSEEDQEISDLEDKLQEYNYPSDFFDFSNTNKTSKFNFEINFDRRKPNQVLFFCEKLFINDIISAEDLAYIKSLAPISGRNFKFSQNQNLLGNQYENFEEAINEIRIFEKMEGLKNPLLSLRVDLNLNHSIEDHKFEKNIPLNIHNEKKFAYLLCKEDNQENENLRKIPGLNKCDNGEFLNEFIENVNEENYNKNFKLFILNEDNHILLDNPLYENLIMNIGEKNHINFFNTKEDLEKEINQFINPSANMKLNKQNFVEVPLGYLNYPNEVLRENFINIKKELFKQIENIKKNTRNLRNKNTYVKKASLNIGVKEFRIKDIESGLKI